MPRNKKKQVQWFFADFETCYSLDKINELKARSDKFSQKDFTQQVDSRVYGAGFSWGQNPKEIDDNYTFANSERPVLDFMVRFLEDNDLDNMQYDILRAYWHNLSFDLSFMKNWLLNELDEYDVSVVGDEKKFYQIKIKNQRTKKEIWILDSLNVLRMKLSEFPEIEGAVKLTDTLVQAMNVTRPLDHIITEDEKIYLRNDVRVLAFGVLDYFADKEWHLTTSSYSFKNFTTKLKEYDLMLYFTLDRGGHMNKYDIQRFNAYNYHNLYEQTCNDVQALQIFESYYRGGQTFANHLNMARVLYNVKGLDVNSLYPFTISNSTIEVCKVPYVANIFCDGSNRPKSNKQAKQSMKRSYIKPANVKIDKGEMIKLDSPDKLYNHIAKLQNKSIADLKQNYFLCFGMFVTLELKDGLTFSPVSKGFTGGLVSDIKFIHPDVRGIKSGRVIFTGSEYDLANWLLYYDITDIELFEYFIFDILKGEDLRRFRSIMSEWSEKKIYYGTAEHRDPRLKAIYKLFMNSTTGKFGEKLRFTKTIIENNQFSEVADDEINTRLLPLIISLISFSRYYMSQNILKVKDDFCYCDTDSIYVINKTNKELKEIFELHPSKLGYFDLEKTFEKAIFMKPKTYVGVLKIDYKKTAVSLLKKENSKLSKMVKSLSNGEHMYRTIKVKSFDCIKKVGSLPKRKYKFTVAGCKPRKELYNRYHIEEFLDNDKIIGVKILKLICRNGGIFLAEKDFVFCGDKGENKELNNIDKSLNHIQDDLLANRIGDFLREDNVSEEQENLKDFDFSHVYKDSTFDSIIRKDN